MTHKFKSIFLSSKVVVILTIFTLILSSLLQQTKEIPLNNIDWDGYGYYLYLPSLFIYKDYTEYKFANDHIQDYKVSSSDYQLIKYEENKKHPRYNLGLALVWTPAFIIANGIASASNSISQDGLSSVYQVAILLTHFLFICLGFWFLRKFLLLIFKDLTVSITLVLIAFATNLFYYTTTEIALTHSYLFSLLACFLYNFHQYKTKSQTSSLFWACITFGLMVLTRSSEILLLILPFFYGLNRNSLKLNFLLSTKLGLSAIAFFSLQLLFFKKTTGQWFRNGYGDRSFEFLNPHLLEGLFSFARGWFIYTPLMFFICYGIGILYKYQRPWFAPILICLSANIYVLFSWDIWWYGDTFGSRPMVQHYAYLSIALAAFVQWMIQWKNPIRFMLYLMLGLMAFLNLFQTWQYNQRILPLGLINKEYYIATLLKTTKDNHRKILIDLPESQLKTEIKEIVLEAKEHIISHGSDHENYKEYTKIKEIPILESSKTLLSNSRIGIEASVSYKGDDFGEWNQPKLVTQIIRNGQSIKWTGVRIPVVMNNLEKDVITYNFICPELEIGDIIQCLIWNKSSDEITVNGFRLLAVK